MRKLELNQLDLLIRKGFHAEANAQLNLILTGHITRTDLLGLAGIARRLSRSQLGLKLLNPIVRPPATKPVVATESEKIEYAACLIRCEMLQEAHAILDEISADQYPQVSMFKAFAHIARWDFEQSAIYLKDFLKKSSSDTYESLIAKVNLAVGYVFLEDIQQAAPILQELKEITFKEKNFLLYSNTLELLGQAEMLLGNYVQAERYLVDAASVLPQSDTLDLFFVQKTQAAVMLFKTRNSKAAIQNMLSLKKRAEEKKFWEQIRDCDYYLMLATKDPIIFHRLYFGTPIESFRKKLLEKMGKQTTDLPEEYLWQLAGDSRKNWIHRQTGENSFSQLPLKQDQLPHRIFLVLSSDFYQPRSVLDLFEKCFPGEYFSPKYSVDRIYQGLQRLRRYFVKNKIPLIIHEEAGFFQLKAANDFPLAILCPKSDVPIKKIYLQKNLQHKLLQMFPIAQTHFQKSSFTSNQFAEALDISNRSAVRFLCAGVQQEWLVKFGKARTSRYRLSHKYFKTDIAKLKS